MSRKTIIGFVISILPWITLTYILYPRLWFAAANLRMIEVASLGRDEGWLGGTVWGGWQTGAPIFSSTYGYAYNNIIWVILRFSAFFVPINQQIVLIVSRGINLAAFFIIGLVSFFFIKKSFGLLQSIIYTFLLFYLLNYPDLILRTTSIQPDIINLLAILTTFYLLLDLTTKFSLKKLILASVAAGIVMAIKFSGFLLLPFILLSLILTSFTHSHYLLKYIKLIIFKLKRIFFASSFIFIISLVEESLIPTYSLNGRFFGLLRFPFLFVLQTQLTYILILAIALLSLKFIIFRFQMRNIWFRRFTFIFAMLSISTIIFYLAFLMFSSKSLFRNELIGNLLIINSGFVDNYSSFSSKIALTIDSLGIFLSVAFLAFTIYIITKLLIAPKRSQFVKLHTLYIISIVWELSFLTFLVFFIPKFESRFLYFLYPALLFIASKLTIELYKFLSDNILHKNKLAVNGLLALIILCLLFISFQKIKNQILISQKDYSCLYCLPGVKTGLWLDKNYKNNNLRIIQETSVYIPERFSYSRFFPWGDPYPVINKYQPDIIFIRGIHMRYALALPDDSIDNYYRVKAIRTKKFLLDLTHHRLKYKMAGAFGNPLNDNDILAYTRYD